MNKILLGSTALIGALVLAQPASAEITVKLGGYVNFVGGFFDHDYQTASENEFDFDNEVEVHVRADGKADNGLLYGVKIELETGGTVTNGDGRAFRTDEANIYVAGSWGRIELGDDDGASDQLTIAAPVAGAGFSDQGDRFGDPALASDFLKVLDSSDATKITYFTPTFSGFRAGVSYAPEANEGDAVILTDAAATYDNFIEAGVQYKGEFSGVGVALSATLSSAEGSGTRSGTAVDDFTAWQLGANLSYAGFTVGGGWVDFDDATTNAGGVTGLAAAGASQAEDGWNLGASYANGPISASVVYAAVDFKGFDYSTWLLDVGYTVAPGLVVGASYRPYNIDLDAGGDLDGHTILIGTKMSF